MGGTASPVVGTAGLSGWHRQSRWVAPAVSVGGTGELGGWHRQSRWVAPANSVGGTGSLASVDCTGSLAGWRRQPKWVAPTQHFNTSPTQHACVYFLHHHPSDIWPLEIVHPRVFDLLFAPGSLTRCSSPADRLPSRIQHGNCRVHRVSFPGACSLRLHPSASLRQQRAFLSFWSFKITRP